jgi:hypothetical protein
MKVVKGLSTLLAVGFFVFGIVAWANAFSIDFESDTVGNKPNGWMSNDSSLVTFSDSNGEQLIVGFFESQSDGLGLLVDTDIDDSILIMEFAADMSMLSLDFGNDDPEYSNPGDVAILTLYNGVAVVGQEVMEMNRDDIMNQTIAYSGLPFNNADFY